MNKLKLERNKQFQETIDLLENTTTSVFLTGKAGTGKSTLLREFRANTNKNIAVLAPTGVAAVNVSGETIHSFFGFKPGVTQRDVYAAANSLDSEKKKLLKKLDTLIIDEISMVRADLFDYITLFLQKVLKSNEPFGGKQVVLIGDLLQLPPIVTRDEQQIFNSMYDSPYFFDSVSMRQVLSTGDPNIFRMIELEKVYRQQDSDFIYLLNAIRNKVITERELVTLNKRVFEEHEINDKNTIFISARNATANRVNDARLEALRGKSKSYDAEITGQVDIESFPAPFVLHLKKNARVMLLNNDSEGRWINGSLGVIEKLDRNSVSVRLDSGQTHNVEPVSWDVTRTTLNKKEEVESEVIGSFKQIPVKLAWAITIHKSQGKTFDSIYVDLGGGAFAEGQTYVALSRATTLEGIYLKQPVRKSDIKINGSVKAFINRLAIGQAEQQLSEEQKLEIALEAIENNKQLHVTYIDRQHGRRNYKLLPESIEDFEHGGKLFKVLNGAIDGETRKLAFIRMIKLE